LSATSSNNPGVGGVSANFTQLSLQNTIIADSNPYAFNCNAGAGSVVTVNADTIIEDTYNCGANSRAGDPGLLALADNGGPTMTHSLAIDSIALNTANADNCPDTDQRGAARDNGTLFFPILTPNSRAAIVNLSGTCDVGAVELP
jgi:hypothetical protein